MYLRIAAGLLIAAVFLAFAAPLAALARALGWRRGRAASVWLHRGLCRALRLRVRRIGTPGPGRRLIVANHVSWLDVLALGAMEPMAFLAKSEVGAHRATRWLVDLQGAVYVERARRRCIPCVNVEMARRMTADGPVALFAEGTTGDGVRLLAFKSSHFEAARIAGACVQPVFLVYRRVAGMAATRSEKLAFAWYGDMAFWPSLKRVLACGGIACDVIYGEPLASDADRKALARAAREGLLELRDIARASERGVFALEAQ